MMKPGAQGPGREARALAAGTDAASVRLRQEAQETRAPARTFPASVDALNRSVDRDSVEVDSMTSLDARSGVLAFACAALVLAGCQLMPFFEVRPQRACDSPGRTEHAPCGPCSQGLQELRCDDALSWQLVGACEGNPYDLDQDGFANADCPSLEREPECCGVADCDDSDPERVPDALVDGDRDEHYDSRCCTTEIDPRCDDCDVSFVPPKIYCDRCLDKLDTYVDVGTVGFIETFTVSFKNMDGSDKAKPRILAMIKIDGTDGGLIHYLEGIGIEDVALGMPVQAIFKPKNQRTGSIEDIIGFGPVKR